MSSTPLQPEAYKTGAAIFAQSRVLVVDDSRMMRMALIRSLQELGVAAITEAANGREALEKVSQSPLDLVLLDLDMPEIDGLSVLRTMKGNASHRAIPVVVVSGSEHTATAIQCIGAGAEDYLTKPFDPVLLRARITSSLERKRLRDLDQHHLQQLELEKSLLEREQEKSERLLLNVLPRAIAARLRQGEENIADKQESVSIAFVDLVGFTAYSRTAHPAELVSLLNRIFTAFDLIIERNGAEKIKTIGDSYMFAAGIPLPNADHARIVARCALDILETFDRLNALHGTSFQIRIGINSGSVVAGIIGKRKFAYDIWGDAVNIASRMESTGEPGKIHISESTREALGPGFRYEPRGTVECKGLGPVATYFLLGTAS